MRKREQLEIYEAVLEMLLRIRGGTKAVAKAARGEMFILADAESDRDVTLYCSACCRTLASMVSAFSSAPCGIDDMTSVFTYVTYAKTSPLRPQASRNCAMCAYVSSKRSLGAMLAARNNTSPY